MSLELSGSDPLVIAKSGILGNTLTLYNKGTHIDIPMEDFCDLVEYALCNTDLYVDDPRLQLLEKLRNATIIDGYNPNKTRIEV